MKEQLEQPNLAGAQDVVCEECQGDVFVPAMQFKKISALVSPSGKDSLIPIQVFACMSCGHINEMFRPKLSNIVS